MAPNKIDQVKRPIIIGNVAGAMEDCPYAMRRMLTEGHLDAIVGDWLSELNIAWNAIRKHDDPSKGYEVGFLEQLEDCIDIIAEKKIKCITNAGALNTTECAKKAIDICRKHGHPDLKVAYVLGDDISELVVDPSEQELLGNIIHLDHPERTLSEWENQPYCGVAYIGAWGITEALCNHADIVICGRVTDASPVIGLAAWWHNWQHDAWVELAGALVAGREYNHSHLRLSSFTGLTLDLIECGPYVTGANFSGVRPYLDGLVDLGFPIAEVAHDGTAIITKHSDAAGFVDEMNVRAQFLYEIQGNKYVNPDVCADITNVSIRNTDKKDRVRVTGAIGSPPPSTTKAIVVAIGGYQAEATFYMNGLDIDAKEQFMRQQLVHAFRNSKFTELSIERHGSAAVNPPRQSLGTVGYRILVKGKKKEDISEEIFRKHVYALRMQFYAGYHMSLDFRTMSPKMFMELFPGLISYNSLSHRVILDGQEITIHHHGITEPPPGKRPSYETASPTPLQTFGPTKLLPLGSVAHGRSGDKGDNCNVGFFVRSAEEYKWIQSFLTVKQITEMMGEDLKEGVSIERCEFPEIWAVHFRFLDFLGGGAASSTRIDMLGKGVAEYLRSKFADVPVRFLEKPISVA